MWGIGVDLIARAAATAGQALQAALGQQVGQMAGGGGLGHLGDRLILRRADALLETALAAVEQAVEHLDLLGQQALMLVLLPEARLGQHAVDALQGVVQAVLQGGEKPRQPGGDIQRRPSGWIPARGSSRRDRPGCWPTSHESGWPDARPGPAPGR